MKDKRGVIVSWGRDIPRSSKLALEIGFDAVYFKNKFRFRILKPVDYLINFIKTILLLRNGTYSRYILVLPPTLLMYSVIFKRKNSEIYADLHNGVLRDEWRRLPFLSKLLNRTIAISHNEIVKAEIDSAFNIDSIVLGDPLTIPLSTCVDCSQFLSSDKINVLVPLSYAKDEPLKFISELIFHFNSDVNFILTGRAPNCYLNSLGVFCTFTGFVCSKTYDSLLKNVDFVFCATNDDLIQMCALIEAVSYSKPVIVKDNLLNRSILNEYPAFYSAYSATSNYTSYFGNLNFFQNIKSILDYSTEFDYSDFVTKFNAIRKDNLLGIFYET